MERPSHTNFKTSCSFSCRITTFGLAALFPLAVVWGLTQGLGGKVIDVIRGPLEVRFDKYVEPRTPPPVPPMNDVETIKSVMPIFDTKPEPNIDAPIPMPADPSPVPQRLDANAAGPDRSPVAVAATHTIPPYPMLAQRLGAEGKVTLQLTVLANGRVGKADIVASSGRGDLDDAARQWIVTHWVYRPALDKGQPAVSQTVVSVIFSLKNQR